MSGIYTLRDLRSLAPPELRNASDSVLINEYAKDLGADPTEVARYFGYNNSGGMARNRIAAGVDNYQANMYGLGGAVARKLGADRTAGWMDQRREANELDAATSTLRARELGAVDDWREVGGIRSGANYVGGLLAQSAPYLAEAAVGGIAARTAMTGTRAALAGAQTAQAAQQARRALNLGSMGGAAAVSYPSAVGDVLSAQRDAGAAPGEERLGSAMLGGVPYAALNAIGAEGVVARGLRPIAGSGERGLLARMASQGGKTSLTEGIAETGQEGVNQFFGRMAVDPNETFFNEDANRRYLDSFIGGAALGGTIGSVAGIRRPIDESYNYDLTQRSAPPPAAQGPVPQLGYSPLAGTPIVFPDGTVALNGEQELQARYGQGAPAQSQQTRPTTDNGLATWRQELVDLGLPRLNVIGKRGESAYEVVMAMREAELAPELQDAVVESLRREATPTNAMKAVAAFTTAQQNGLTPEMLEDAIQAAADKQFSKVQKLVDKLVEQAKVDAAIEERNRNVGENVVAPAGDPAAQPEAADAASAQSPAAPKAPADGTLESTASVASQAAGAAAIRANDGSVNPVVSSGQQAGLPASATAGVGVSSPLSDTAPTDVLVRRRKKRVVIPTQPAAAFVAPEADAAPQAQTTPAAEPLAGTTLEDRAEIERLTGAAGPANAILQDETGRRVDATQVEDILPQLLAERFKDSTQPERDAEIATAYLTAMREAPRGSKVKVQEAVGKRYGVGAQAVRKIGNTTELVKAGKALGLTEQEVRGFLEVRDNTKAAPGQAAQSTDNAAQDAQLAEGLRAAGVETAEGETAGFGFDDARAWAAPTDTAEAKANAVQSVLEQQDALRNTIEELEAQGQFEVAEVLQTQIQELDKALTAAIADYEAFLVGKRSKAAAAEPAKAKGKKPKKAAQEVADADTEVDTRSDFEKARDAWDAEASTYDGAPLFDELTADQQERWVDYGPENWSPSDVATELARVQKESGTEFGKGEGDPAAGPYTAKELEAELKAFMRVDSLGRNIIIVDKPIELDDMRDVVTGLTNARAFGWTRDGRAVLIASRISKGQGRAKFMHEVGSHLGMERLLPPQEFDRLVDQVISWAKRSDNSLETRLAKRAVVRVPENTAPASVRDEIVAYFVEEATLAGVDPTATRQLQNPVAKWMRSMFGAMKRALIKLGFKPEKLTAKDVVNMAYGAASLRIGADTATESDIEFGKNPLPAAPTRSTIERNVSQLPKAMQSPVRNTIMGVGDVVRKVLDRVVFTNVLIERAVKAGIGSAERFARLQAEMGTKARELEREVEKIADMYVDVEEKDKGDGDRSLNRFLFESTRQAKWGYGKNADPEMKAWFESLGPNSQKLARAIFAHGDKILAQKKEAVENWTNSEYDSQIEAAQAELASATTAKERREASELLAGLKADKANSLKKFQTLFKIREGQPYAPIKRMGNHVVVAKSAEYRAAEDAGDDAKVRKLQKDADHYHVSFVESKNEARMLADRLREQGFYGNDDGAVSFFERSADETELFGGESMFKALTKLRSRVDDGSGAGKAQLQRMVTDLWLSTLAEDSARKSEMRRKGVDGEVDMLRSFAAQGRADAQFIASVEYNPQIEDSMRAMRKEVKRGGNRDRKSEIHNELMERYAKSLEVVRNPMVDKLTRMSSVYFLASSPMYYLQNLTQPWMMSVPAMAGKHDYTKVSSELVKAYAELGPVLKSVKLNQQLSKGFDFTQVPTDVRDAIQKLVNRGRIDIGLDTELGEFRIDGSSKFADGWNKVDKGLRLLVQKGEAINRLSTAIAAYRLELARTGSDAAALDYADKILLDTHGDYGRFNAPKYFNYSLGRVALQFRKFQLIQLTFYAKLIKEAFTNPAERKMALKSLGFALGHTALLAGAMGLPGYAAIAWALGAVLGDDEPFDLTYEMRKAIGSEELANLIMRGAPTLAGADISGKVGAGTMLSVMPFSNADLSTGRGQAEAFGTLMGGASLGMGMRIADGIGLMMSGDWVRGAERVLPKGLGDAIKGYREANEGMTRRNGDVILPASEINAVETFMTAIGMSPVQTTVTYERRNRARDLDKSFQDRSTRIKNDYAKAFRSRDTEGMRQAREAWTQLQEARRRNGYPVQPMSNLLKAPQEQAKRERNTVGGVQFNNSNRSFAQQQSQF